MSITTKHTLTNAEIEKDIINALKNPPEMSKSSNGKWMIVAIIALVPLILIELIYPALLIWAVLAAAVLLIVCLILHRRRIEKVSIDDFEITREVVHSTREEHYRGERGRIRLHGRAIISVYVVRFESGKCWRMPKKHYAQNPDLQRSDFALYNETHRGDTFITVAKKSTGEIIMAYNTEAFEYKN